jgi:hypothetical protein
MDAKESVRYPLSEQMHFRKPGARTGSLNERHREDLLAVACASVTQHLWRWRKSGDYLILEAAMPSCRQVITRRGNSRTTVSRGGKTLR